MEPINLKTTYPQHRISYDESAETRKDPWMMQIKTRVGVIYPYSDSLLALQVDYHRGIANRIKAMGLQPIQWGDRERTFVFPLERFDELAAIVKPRRKKVYSPEQLVVMRARGKALAAKRLSPAN